MMEDIIAIILSTGILTLIMYFLTRRKSKLELCQIEIENASKIATLWRELSEGMEKRLGEEIAELRAHNCELEKRVEQLIRENAEQDKEMKLLRAENKRLLVQLKIFNRKYGNENDFD